MKKIIFMVLGCCMLGGNFLAYDSDDLEKALRLSKIIENRVAFPTHVDLDLTKANLFGAHLTGANLAMAHLRGANLEGANLEGADFFWADLEGVDLEGARNMSEELKGYARSQGAINVPE